MAETTSMQKRTPSEASLLSVIHKRLPMQQLRQLRDLEAKLETETVSERERKELLRLVELAELADVERAEALLTLAQERQTTLGQLMQELQLD